MSDLNTAADSLRRFAVQFQGILDVADALEQVGKLDTVIKEREKAAEKVAGAIEKAKAELAGLEAKINDQIEAANANIVSMKNEAANEAEKAKARANDWAEKIFADAEASVAAILAAAEEAKAVAAAETDAAKSAVELAKTQVAEIEVRRDRLAEEVKNLEARAEKVKAAASKLLEA